MSAKGETCACLDEVSTICADLRAGIPFDERYEESGERCECHCHDID